MNLKEYEELCRCCDEILKSRNSSVITKSIPWLHVLNAHPTTQQKYENIFNKSKKNTYISVFRSIGRFLRNITFGYSFPSFVSTNPEIKQTDVLIFSHLINMNQVGGDTDFYFGDIALDLKKQNLASQLVLINHLGVRGVNLVDSWKKNSIPRIILANRLSVKEEIMILCMLVRESYRLFKCMNNETDSCLKIIYKTSAKAALSFESVSALRFFYQVENLIRKLKPKAIFTTMEGHALERLAFCAARRVNPNIKCFGYQHAILFPHQHSIKRSLGPDYDPDIIFTAGHKTTSVLKKGYQNTKVKFENIGTHRYSCPKTIFDLTNWNLEPVCLVLPDGNLSECLDLCRFAIQAAADIHEIQFVIRLHPLNSVEMLVSEDDAFSNLPSNLSFSENQDIQNDFNISRWTLYRGSGSAIHSVMAGCRPIYISSNESISIDPLYLTNTGRKFATNTDDLKAILMRDLTLGREVFFTELESLFRYCKEYFTPASSKSLINELK
ncbi:hypothetical protein OAB62_06125 [Pseudomonadales bacterium]|nr:hypothetical protein [Pseudomonadales bacterium]